MWRFDRDPLPQLEYPSGQTQQQDSRIRYYRGLGGSVIPGNYTVTLSSGSASSTAKVKVNHDPRMDAPDTDALKKNYERARAIGSRIESINVRLKPLAQVRESLAKSEGLIRENPGFAVAVAEEYKAVKEELASMDKAFSNRQDGLSARIGGYRVLLTATGALTEQENKAVADAETALDEGLKLADAFMAGSWANYIKKLSQITLPGDAVVLK
jgi:hypothetical protein